MSLAVAALQQGSDGKTYVLVILRHHITGSSHAVRQ